MEISALKNVSADFLLSLSTDELTEFLNDSNDTLDYIYYNRAEFYQPYGYQKEFFEQGKHKLHRYLSAGNRVGKTYCGSMEFSYHITGRYPDWWKGRKVNNSGRTYWCIGFNLQMVREIQQKALLGTDNIGLIEEIGSGSIPRDCILLDGIIKDGAQVKTIYIRHEDGGTNTLTFFGATDPDVLMGREVSGAWCDEESLYSERIHNQLEARVANAIRIGEDGFIMYTATPEQGATWLYRKFRDDESGLLGFTNVTWSDVPERFTPAYIERKKKTFSAHEIDLRIKGIPAIGRGAVFKLDEEKITYDPALLNVQSNWLACWGSDWGDVNDATALVLSFLDPNTGIYYVHDLLYFGKEGEERDAQAVAPYLQNHHYRAAPIIVPHDESAKGKSPETQGKILQRMGFYVPLDVFRNPLDNQLNVARYGISKQERYNDIERGLIEMRYLFDAGKLKINKHLQILLRDMRSYSYKYKDNSKELSYAGEDHSIDAARYSVMSLMASRGHEVYRCSDLDNNRLSTFDTVKINY
ncbi:terminase family protein [Escherichia coli]|nr:terminase family protein [Escherichia coli]